MTLQKMSGWFLGLFVGLAVSQAYAEYRSPNGDALADIMDPATPYRVSATALPTQPLALAPEMTGPPAWMLTSGDSSKASQRASNSYFLTAALSEGAEPWSVARLIREQAATMGPMDSGEQKKPAAEEGEAKSGSSFVAYLWKLLIVMPALGVGLIAFDLRGHRKDDDDDSQGPPVKIYPSRAAKAAVPAPLAALGLDDKCCEEDVKKAYRVRAKNSHPDRGGDSRQFLELQRNFEQAVRFVRAAAVRAAWQSQPAY